ncbi:protein Njmu-R1-like isoform X1 [Mizuhopecten yessoensis]|uniref:protein Njmu-R1-like isoform X1 n=1 Tax=Mizuhopecten yessoensis TaxID=6573 RepID=UPI000B459A18|nr:protein Njmu-R1-like isoform X1 [Mizuhopecten yessoensis]
MEENGSEENTSAASDEKSATSDMEQKEEGRDFDRHFALYSCNVHKEERNSETESIASENSQTDSNVSLSVLSTDLDASVETELRKFIGQKLMKNLVYSDTGSISSMEYRSDDDVKTSFSCYYCMLENVEEKQLVVNGDNTPDPQQRKYIVCFMALQKNSLDYFQRELDVYCNGVVQYLDQQVCCDPSMQEEQDTQDKSKVTELTNIDTSVRTYLENWCEVTMDYTCRCMKILKQSAKYILYGALVDARFQFEGMTDQQKDDLQRFLKACNLSEILKQTDQEKREASPASTGSLDLLVDLGEYNAAPQQTITLTLAQNMVNCSPEDCTIFCEDWGKVLNKTDLNRASQIRHVLEAFKIKYIQSINTLKRLLIQAEADYYALYKSYVFIKNSGNAEVLLNYGHLDSIPEVQDVVKSLKEFIKEIKQTPG